MQPEIDPKARPRPTTTLLSSAALIALALAGPVVVAQEPESDGASPAQQTRSKIQLERRIPRAFGTGGLASELNEGVPESTARAALPGAGEPAPSTGEEGGSQAVPVASAVPDADKPAIPRAFGTGELASELNEPTPPIPPPAPSASMVASAPSESGTPEDGLDSEASLAMADEASDSMTLDDEAQDGTADAVDPEPVANAEPEPEPEPEPTPEPAKIQAAALEEPERVEEPVSTPAPAPVAAKPAPVAAAPAPRRAAAAPVENLSTKPVRPVPPPAQEVLHAWWKSDADTGFTVDFVGQAAGERAIVIRFSQAVDPAQLGEHIRLKGPGGKAVDGPWQKGGVPYVVYLDKLKPGRYVLSIGGGTPNVEGKALDKGVEGPIHVL